MKPKTITFTSNNQKQRDEQMSLVFEQDRVLTVAKKEQYQMKKSIKEWKNYNEKRFDFLIPPDKIDEVNV